MCRSAEPEAPPVTLTNKGYQGDNEVSGLGEVEQAVLRLQAGDRLALTPLYSAYAEAALRTAFLITRNRATAEDAVQEAFVQVLRNISALRDPAAFRPWFYRIVVNAARRLSRKKKVPVPPELTSPESPDEALIGSEEAAAVRLAVAQLNEAHREVITLRYYTELSEAEIAQVLGVPPGTVKSRLHRAKEALHERLSAGRRQ